VNESEVLDDVGFGDRAEHFEELAQRLAFGALGEVADEQFHHCNGLSADANGKVLVKTTANELTFKQIETTQL